MIKNIRLALCCVVGQVVNLRPIGGALWARPAGSTHNAEQTPAPNDGSL